MKHQHILISAVTSEFGSYRPKLREQLAGKKRWVKIQEDFEADPNPTLDKLDGHIRACDIVIHIVGSRTGSSANEFSLAWVREHYPNLAQYDALSEVIDGRVKASYTQWEAYLALLQKKQLLVVAPTITAPRDTKPFKRSEATKKVQRQQQQDHLQRLRILAGCHIQIHFTDAVHLAAEVLKSGLLKIKTPSISAKPLSNIPFHSVLAQRNLKGRDGFLEKLHEEFRSGRNHLLLLGMGGIGKTRLALDYASEYKTNYSALFFLQADTPVRLENSLASLCGPQALNLYKYQTRTLEERQGAVRRWLEEHPGWLLILDDINTPSAVQATKKWLPLLNGGHVLLTSRVDLWRKTSSCLKLEVLPLEDAQRFLLDYTDNRQKTQTDEKDALTLARDLGQLPLALEQAADYIDSLRITLKAYSERWLGNQKDIWNWFDRRLQTDKEISHHLSRSVIKTWDLSFTQLNQETKLVLNRLVWLAADPVPRSLEEVSIPNAEVLDLEEALSDLACHSLVNYTEDKGSFIVHRLVQQMRRICLDAEKRQQSFKESLEWIDGAFIGKPHNDQSWPSLNLLRPHALEIVTKHSPMFDDPEPTERLRQCLSRQVND